MFVLPLARPGGGIETLLLQWQLPVMLATSLEEFKQRGSGATPYLTMTHYEELGPKKGVVLIRGDVLQEQRLSVTEVRAVHSMEARFEIIV
jgi:hypothetical protein